MTALCLKVACTTSCLGHNVLAGIGSNIWLGTFNCCALVATFKKPAPKTPRLTASGQVFKRGLSLQLLYDSLTR